MQNKLGFILNPIKSLFGYTKEIPKEEFTEKMVLVVKGVPIEEITAETVEVYETIGSEIVGLTVIVLAILAMIIGSLVFPGSSPSEEKKE